MIKNPATPQTLRYTTVKCYVRKLECSMRCGTYSGSLNLTTLCQNFNRKLNHLLCIYADPLSAGIDA